MSKIARFPPQTNIRYVAYVECEWLTLTDAGPGWELITSRDQLLIVYSPTGWAGRVRGPPLEHWGGEFFGNKYICGWKQMGQISK